MPQDTGLIAKFLDIFSSNKQKNSEEDEKITVHAAVSRFSFFYEKIRNMVDYKDEHLIRKAAILRILKRLIILESDPRKISEQLIRELIAARYLQNSFLPVTAIDEVSWCVYKLQLVMSINAGGERHIEWVRGIVSVEIEELLVDAELEKSLAAFLFDRIKNCIRLRNADLDERMLHLQVYISIYRTLLKADDEVLGYKLLRAFLPEWVQPQHWADSPRPLAERLLAMERRISLQLSHPLASRFQRAIKPWSAAMNMLVEVWRKKPDGFPALLHEPEALHAAVKKVCDERYSQTRKRVRRATLRAVIYLFFTKMVLALILEGPVELYLYGELHYRALIINLTFPPLLMFIVGLFIRLPSLENTRRIQNSLDELLYRDEPAFRSVSAPLRRTPLARALLMFTYLLTFVLTFGAIGLLLEMVAFTWISTLIFIFFLCLVSFFAFRIRISAREDIVIDNKVTVGNSLVDFLSLPVLRAGRWLSLSISRLNIFLFFFDFIFEAPYKMFLQLLEEWFAFAKEKKDELQP